ncbi:hypothetical protein [Tomitella biformata]|uniref:hypothetical protein n=1 Tax=Tomitella biformata TaxID=630403 RepID=UPI0004B31507|nr:hypothetical protein [Tomitella biformata]
MSSPLFDLVVIPRELRRFSSALATGADEVAALEVEAPFAAAAAALLGSEIAAALQRAPDLVKAAFEAVEGRLRGLSEVAQENADSFEMADVFRGGN